MTDSPSQSATSGRARATLTPLDIVRAVVLVAVLASLALWGFTRWDLPMSLILGIGAPLFTLLLWALVLSPKPVLRIHPFIRAVAELLVYAAVTMCWWDMGQVWVGLGFAVVAIAAGLIAGRRALR